ncbi:MAG: FtsB family cell division protein, partial [Sciscionella sp.]
QVSRLQARKAQLSDPDQIEAEARLRLRYVMPGETPYVVQLPHGNVAATKPTARKPEQHRHQVWYRGLWHSVAGSGK